MVSFQCHGNSLLVEFYILFDLTLLLVGCGDVVKKPKLDQHRGRCHAGFDCIDCSTTFNTPAEYKSHTSCISEAEKYQKNLYKGPKKGAENHKNIGNEHSHRPTAPGSTSATENSSTDEVPNPRQSNAQWHRSPQENVADNSNGYPEQNGRFNSFGSGYGSQGNRGGWGQQQYRRPNTSGANDTPLGTSTRNSPAQGAVMSVATHRFESRPSQNHGKNENVISLPALTKPPRTEQTRSKDEKKDKKSQDPTPVLETPPLKDVEMISATETAEQERKRLKREKKEKKWKEESTSHPELPEVQTSSEKKKSKTEQDKSNHTSKDADSAGEVDQEKKEKKKRKREKESRDELGLEKDEKKRRKREKSRGREDAEIPTMSALIESEQPDRKSKKPKKDKTKDSIKSVS
ncbi:hypothetical protein CPB83DRAFT_446796 [Crepidotus variabilis]|uniref:Zinc finger C2H2 LYAR-type domain-containing protein n=1 Tax=Crepidotus variabilis TaxID=179855 RepID=A0A9P6EDG3_9AGAR|nr:hypothetical protein CPB83DRAFT_446796 [Crepidotus variabilis]